ncbi:MAG: alpha/beta hydrolase [Steroidobacteraceae bacterium]
MQGSAQLARWIASGERRTLAGHTVFVRTAIAPGRPRLLLIHGYPTASYDWHPMWDALAGHHSLLAPDLLGFGMSAKPRGHRYTVSEQADLCQALVESEGTGPVHLLAHDYGDTVAQELLAREAEGRIEIASACLLNGGLFPETHRARPVQKLLATPVIGPLVSLGIGRGGFIRSMRSIGGRVPPSAQDLDDLWLLLERDGGRRAIARLISYIGERRANRARWVGALTSGRVPLRLVCGALDPVSGAHMAGRYRELVPSADVVLLDDVGHYPQLEAPERVLEAYGEFRRRLALPAERP